MNYRVLGAAAASIDGLATGHRAITNPFIMKLGHGAELTAIDCAKLAQVASRTRLLAPRTDIIVEGEAPADVRLVLDGVACRYKIVGTGERQIMAFLIPGDLCDLHVAILGAMDHSIMTLSACTVVDIPRSAIIELADHPRIMRALWWASLTDEAILREWLVGAGRRGAEKQIAHLFCELLVRLQAVGRADESSYALPLTQEELADAVGLSAIHVNRVLHRLREDGLVVFKSGVVTVLDWERLRAFSGFTANYLHFKPRSYIRDSLDYGVTLKTPAR